MDEIGCSKKNKAHGNFLTEISNSIDCFISNIKIILIKGEI